MSAPNELLNYLDKLHTTELGVVRIKRNLSLDTDDVVGSNIRFQLAVAIKHYCVRRLK